MYQKVDSLELVSRSCATLSEAKRDAWNAFAGLHNDPLYKQPQVLALAKAVDTLRAVRSTLEIPNATSTVFPTLAYLRKTVLNDITQTIHELTIAAGKASDMDADKRSTFKHKIEDALITSAHHLRRMFDAFGITSHEITPSEKQELS